MELFIIKSRFCNYNSNCNLSNSSKDKTAEQMDCNYFLCIPNADNWVSADAN